MVYSIMGIAGLGWIVWGHHMFMSGMNPILGTSFMISTMVIAVPSAIKTFNWLGTLWGGSIRFTTPMLFALAFLPMFGIGGLTGLPLGLAASDVMLHDTYYVVGHFHYLVAPGTIFAIFAGVYHWFPRITGRMLHRGLGLAHFWGSLVLMNAIFLPMFAMGLAGVNRRLYDAGTQYQNAQATLGWNAHMTWAAVALGLVQLPFLVNLAWSLRRGPLAGRNPWGADTLDWGTDGADTGNSEAQGTDAQDTDAQM
jgi:cytochrome c oxidase subunit 1